MPDRYPYSHTGYLFWNERGEQSFLKFTEDTGEDKIYLADEEYEKQNTDDTDWMDQHGFLYLKSWKKNIDLSYPGF